MAPHYDSEYLAMLKKDPKILLTIRELSEIILAERDELAWLNRQNDDLKSRLSSIISSVDWFIEQLGGAKNLGAATIEKWDMSKEKAIDDFGLRIVGEAPPGAEKICPLCYHPAEDDKIHPECQRRWDAALPEKRKAECGVGLPYGQSGVSDFCALPRPCPIHEKDGERMESRQVIGQIGPEWTTCGPCGTPHMKRLMCPKCFGGRS